MRNSVLFILLFIINSSFGQNNQQAFPAPGQGCLSCHQGIEPIRQHPSEMMQAIYKKGARANDPNGCVVCHGGNAIATTKQRAHFGSMDYLLSHDGPKHFYPDPGSSWINENTCGQCHQEQVFAQMNSLMMTEQGKIQGTLWSFGGMEGYQHNIGNYVTSNPDDPHDRLGTDAYRKYMAALKELNPLVYPERMKEPPCAYSRRGRKKSSIGCLYLSASGMSALSYGFKGPSKARRFSWNWLFILSYSLFK